MNQQAQLPWWASLALPRWAPGVLIVLVTLTWQLVIYVHFGLRWHASLSFRIAPSWYEPLGGLACAQLIVCAAAVVWPARPWLCSIAALLLGAFATGVAAAPPEGYLLFDWKTAPLLPAFSMGSGPYRGNWLRLLVLDGGGVAAFLLGAAHLLLFTLYRRVRRTHAQNAMDLLLVGFGMGFLLLVPLSVQEGLLLQIVGEPDVGTALSSSRLALRLWYSVLAVGLGCCALGGFSLAWRLRWLRKVKLGKVPGFSLLSAGQQPRSTAFFDVPGSPLGYVLVCHDQGKSVVIGSVASVIRE